MKLRLCAGVINHYVPEEGWQNVHLDISDRGIWHPELGTFVRPEFIGDIANMIDFRDSMFDEVRLHHVLEHLTFDRGRVALGEIHRVLKPGGILDIEVPDMDRIIEAWKMGRHQPADLQQWIYGEQLPHHEPGDSHRYGYSGPVLKSCLQDAGFRIVEEPETGLAVRYRAEALKETAE